MSVFDVARNLLSKVKASQPVQYFNPTSNQGNNFWSTPGAAKLANVQKAINQVSPTVRSRYAALQSPDLPAKVQNYFERLPNYRTSYPQLKLSTVGKVVLPMLLGTPEERYKHRRKLDTMDAYLKKSLSGKDISVDETREYQKLSMDQVNNLVMGFAGDFGTVKPLASKGLKLVETLHANPARTKGFGSAFEGEVKNYFRQLRSAADNPDLMQGGKTEIKKFASKIKMLVDEAETLYHSGEVDKAIQKSEEALTFIHERATLQHAPEYLRGLKDEAVEAFKEQGAGKTSLEGLMSETLAQTRFRRQAGLKVQDVYTKAKDMLDNFFGSKGAYKNIPPEKKVGIVDYVRTPDRVLKKIGLGKEAEELRYAWDTYKLELPKELTKVAEWQKRVPSPESNVKIFDYLDGTLDKSKLTPEELKVGNEVKSYLKRWADKLHLPEDKRVREYISHVFEKGDIELEFDPEIAKMIQGEIPGSVYDPFLQKRKGSETPYLHDAWRALDAYIKRGVRKFNMDPALKMVEEASVKLDLESTKYVQRLTSGINMQPREIDSLLDNFIKSTPLGYKFTARPTAYLSGKLRNWAYRGTLGLNVGSAVRNLTQSVNTYSKLGEKWTAAGAFNFFRKAASRNLDELYQVGVLNDSFIDARNLSAVKRMSEKMDKGLFFFFDWAEKINRGIAYYGAKAKFMSQKVDELQAQKLAKDLVRTTQFTFGAVDTPVVLQSDVSKLVLQFQSFNIKQAEFLAEMIKNKEFLGLLRYSISSLALVGLLGKSLGYDVKDFIPFSGVLSGETKLGQTPPIQLAKGIIGSAVKAPDEYGNVPEGNFFQRLAGNKDVTGAVTAFIPGGVQAKKTLQGLQSYSRGASLTPTGRTRFEVEQTPGNLIKAGVFGQYYTKEGRVYVKNLGTSQAERLYKELERGKTPAEKDQVWKQLVSEGKITKDNATDVKKYIYDQEMKLTTKERQIRNLPVKSLDRANAIRRQLARLKTNEEKDALWKRYVQLGIITEQVAKQLKALN